MLKEFRSCRASRLILPAGGKTFIVILKRYSFACQQTLSGRPAVQAGGLNQPVTPSGLKFPVKQDALIQEIRGAYNHVHTAPFLFSRFMGYDYADMIPWRIKRI
jgi:hypothetical protein